MAAEIQYARTDANTPPAVLCRCRPRTCRRPNRKEVRDHSADDRVTGDRGLPGRPTKVRFESTTYDESLVECTVHIHCNE